MVPGWRQSAPAREFPGSESSTLTNVTSLREVNAQFTLSMAVGALVGWWGGRGSDSHFIVA